MLGKVAVSKGLKSEGKGKGPRNVKKIKEKKGKLKVHNPTLTVISYFFLRVHGETSPN